MNKPNGFDLSAMMTLERIKQSGLLKTAFQETADPDLKVMRAVMRDTIRKGRQAYRKTGMDRKTVQKLAGVK